MDILVTGGAGFIGANLVRRLAADGHKVVVLDDLSSGRAANLSGLDIDFRVGSILDQSALAAAVVGVDSIVHLAAIPSVPRSIASPVLTHEANATGTVRVLEAARTVGAHVTVASSSSVYGASSELPKRESMVARPLSPYAVSKLAAESYAIAWQHSFGLSTIAFRFFNVYGPLQPAGHAYAAVIPSFVSAAISGQPVQIHGDGTQTRDFTFVDSVTGILAEAALRQVVHETPVNLAFGSRRSLLDVVSELESLLHRGIGREFGPPRPGDVADSQADTALLRQLFPAAGATSFDLGLAATIDWMRWARASSPPQTVP